MIYDINRKTLGYEKWRKGCNMEISDELMIRGPKDLRRYLTLRSAVEGRRRGNSSQSHRTIRTKTTPRELFNQPRMQLSSVKIKIKIFTFTITPFIMRDKISMWGGVQNINCQLSMLTNFHIIWMITQLPTQIIASKFQNLSQIAIKNIARIVNAVQVTICLPVSTSVY